MVGALGVVCVLPNGPKFGQHSLEATGWESLGVFVCSQIIQNSISAAWNLNGGSFRGGLHAPKRPKIQSA